MENFDKFGLIEPLLRAVQQEGYTTPTPIQQKAIPHVIEGKDLLGCAQTGTGKTAAFALPILHRLADNPVTGRRKIRCLVLTPTRELAAQVNDSFKTYGKHVDLKSTVVFGGVRQVPQTNALQRGVEILVATPGRLMDLMQQGFVHLDKVEIFVLDEADRMLDMGFIEDVRRIVTKLPKERQTLFFSATMPPKVRQLSNSILNDPVHVSITPEAPAAEAIEQAVYFVDHGDKRELLIHLLKDEKVTRALIFTRTKHGADKVARYLNSSDIKAEAIHSNKTQNARTRALEGFKLGKTRVLVASDIAARGLDVDDISHVINYDLPQEPEVYVHRIGRTGRAGAAGTAFTFCDSNERNVLDIIEKLIQARIPTVIEHPWHSPIPSNNGDDKKRYGGAPRGGSRSGRSGNSQGQRQRSGGSRTGGRKYEGKRSGPARQDQPQQGQASEGGNSANRRPRRGPRKVRKQENSTS